MVLGQCTQEMKYKLEGHEGWPTILEEQDEVGLIEIVTLERSLALNVQGRRSEVDYLQAFKANADAINLAGGHAGGSIAAAKLVAKEQGLDYDAADQVKQATIMEGAAKRYLAALAFTGLNSDRHKQLKADVRHDWVRNNTDSLPRTYERLMEMAGGYEKRDRPRQDPRGAGVALINTAGRGRGEQGRGGRGGGAGRGSCGGRGGQEESKNEEGGSTNTRKVNNDGKRTAGTVA